MVPNGKNLIMTPDDRSQPATPAQDRSSAGAGKTPRSPPERPAAKVVVVVLVVAGLAGAYGVLSWSGALAEMMDSEALRKRVESLGLLGPISVIVLMSVAIVLNPIPSAPIALASGAAFGHLWGTVYVAIGAEAGALIAFGIARLVGYDVLHRWLGRHVSLGVLESQNALMAAVFLSRLLPFISFDIVSYAAGLTPLKLWRFAVATLAGIIPASFLLAHFGGELGSLDSERVIYAVVALGAVTGVPIVGKMVWDHYRKKPARGEDPL